MKLVCKSHERGITLTLSGRRKKKFSLVYPKDIWKRYPKRVKEILVDNLAHLLTINLPLIAGKTELEYNTSVPLFKSFFSTVVINSLPHAVEDYKAPTDQTIKRFLNVDYKFKDFNVKFFPYEPIGKIDAELTEQDERSIIPFSCGKDSMLSLAVCDELGLNPIPVYVNDTLCPKENKLKMKFGKKISKQFGLKFFVVRNEIERLNDFEFWNKGETCVGYSHMMSGFCLIALPFVHRFRAKYIVVGNQQNMNFTFKNKDGFSTYPSFDQTRRWMTQQDVMVKLMTSGRTGVMSVIEPLTNIAIVKLLHGRYKELGKYEISCDCIDASDKKRWCHVCSKCARLSIFMKANDFDTRSVGFRSNMLDKKHKKLYCLFDGKDVDCYEKSKEAKDEQLLAFYMAYKRGEKGYLIDLFKKQFLKEAKANEDRLRDKFFSIHKSVTMPRRINKAVESIYREELSKLFS